MKTPKYFKTIKLYFVLVVPTQFMGRNKKLVTFNILAVIRKRNG